MDDDLKKKLDELVKHADYIVSNPDTLEKMKAKGLPIKSVFTTYNEYLDKLFEEKRKISDSLIKKLPRLDENIANATIQSLYDELKQCFVLGIPGAGITLAVILLELTLKYRLFEERVKSDKNSPWEHIEQLDFTKVVNTLKNQKVISLEEKKELDKFNEETRNPYIHYNIKKLLKDVVATELPSINIETGEVVIHRNVKATDYPHLWFSAKKVRDKQSVESIVNFCIFWGNKLLSKTNKIIT